MFEADLHRQVRRATLAGCGIAAVMLATAASAGEAGSAGCAAVYRPASGTAWVQVNVGESERTALVIARELHAWTRDAADPCSACLRTGLPHAGSPRRDQRGRRHQGAGPRRQACTPSASTIAVLAIHSVDDPENVYDGDPATSPAYWMHCVEDAMAGWAEHLGCGGIETMAVTQNVERREYRGCGTTGALTLYALRGSGHTWPGSSFAFPDYLGATEANIDATVLSLDWFERHRRAGNSGS